MERNKKTRVFKRSAFAASLTASLCLGFAAPLLAASPPKAAADNPSPNTDAASNEKPAQKCLTDLRAFDDQMQKDGYWLSGFGYGYGYPVYGYGYGYDELRTSGASSTRAANWLLAGATGLRGPDARCLCHHSRAARPAASV